MMKRLPLTALMAGLVHSGAYAVEPVPYITESGIAVTPFFDARTGYDDNVIKVPDAQIRSWFVQVRPAVIAEFESDTAKYYTSYAMQAGHYGSSRADSYTDHYFNASGRWLFDIRHRLNLDYQLAYINERRGEGLTEGFSRVISNPLRYSLNGAEARYIYGADEAKGRIETVIGILDKDYKESLVNVGPNTLSTEYYNWEEPYYALVFYYALSSATKALIQVRKEDRRYDTIDPGVGISRDSDTYYLWGGAKWDITGKTTGEVKLGLQDKHFQDGRREDFSGFSWEAKMSWKRTNYSEFRLNTSRYARDPDIGGDYVRDTRITLDWEHFWTPKISTLSTLGYVHEDYTGTNRRDREVLVDLGARYALTRWWDAYAGFTINNQNSTLPNFIYDKNIYYLGVELSL